MRLDTASRPLGAALSHARLQARVGFRLFNAVVLATVLVPAVWLSWARAAELTEVRALRDGVGSIAAPGVPGPLCVFGPHSFSIAVGKSGADTMLPVVAGAELGRGRVVAFGHTGYTDPSALAVADTGRLMANALRWTAGATAQGPIRVGVRGQPELVRWLNEQGFRAVALEGERWTDQLKHAHVVCLRPANLSPAEVEALSAYVHQGGGLVAADLGWGWLQLHPGKSLLTDHGGNRLLSPAGIVWADGTLERTSADGFATESVPTPLAHAGKALAKLVGSAELKSATDIAQASAAVLLAARSLPADDKLLRPRLEVIRRKRARDAIPSRERPIKATDALARLAVALEHEAISRLAVEQVTAHPAAKHFPGEVPKQARRVTQTVRLDTAVPSWHSTGLYAPPGEPIRVSVPASAAGKGLAVRIGAHSDRLWHANSWSRWPEICRQFPVAAAEITVANPFGGLIYLDVPKQSALGVTSVEIAGAVEAPHYALGRTAAGDWPEIRRRPAPWAELEGERVVLTVPSAEVRNLRDPEKLMEFWDGVVAACDQLSGRPRQEAKQRYVADVQISAGYMHSGYPIMTHLDVAGPMVDRESIVGFKRDGAWGLFHEIGHNYQSPDWTFEGTGEVTCNLFTLYLFHKACGRDDIFDLKCPPASRDESLRRYLREGRSFEQWKRDPFLALQMYVQMQRAFGWETFIKVFAEYRALPDGERPKSDGEKRDAWMVRFSRAAGRNLGQFFDAWGVPVSAEAKASVADLPQWMPEEMAPGRGV